MKRRYKGLKEINFGSFTLTAREIIFSIIIFSVLIVIGFKISDCIKDGINDNNDIYNKALKIENSEEFKYGMKTNIGNAFVSGKLICLDPVEDPRGYLKDLYSKITITKEIYQQHTETYTTTDSKGKVHTHTRVYYSWDKVSGKSYECNSYEFAGVKFNTKKLKVKETKYEATNTIGHVRYIYRTAPLEMEGSIFTNLSDNTISDNTKFVRDMNVQELYEDKLQSQDSVILFWIIWCIIICGIIFGFIYLDNNWLY